MEVAVINRLLGQRAGVLELVFGLLPPRDMKNVVLVCRLWREVGEAPGFWAWVILEVTRETRKTRDNMSTMPERLGSRRMGAVRELKVESWVELSEEVLEAVVRHPLLRVVRMNETDLSSVDPGLLARVVARMEEVEMSWAELTGQQLEAVMTA